MKDTTADKLNELLRGERAAAETYKQALSKFGTDPRATDLREIQSDHFDAVLSLKKHVQMRHEEADETSGAWGTFAKTVMGSAKLFGDKAALKALKTGEEHGLKQYEELANDNDVDSNARSLMRDKLIPRQRGHINKIDHIMQTMNRNRKGLNMEGFPA